MLHAATDKRHRPASGHVVNWRRRRKEAIDSTLEMLLEKPWSPITFETVAEEAGLTFWQVYYSFDGLEDIYRGVVASLLEYIEREIDEAPSPAGRVHDAIRVFVDWIADIFLSPAYRALVYLRLRDGPDDPWLEMNFNNRVREKLVGVLGSGIVATGRVRGFDLVCDAEEVARALATLEANTALTALFGDVAVERRHIEATLRDTVSCIWASTRACECQASPILQPF